MRALQSAIVLASILSLLSDAAHAQLVRGFKYMYNESVDSDSGPAAWAQFAPVGPSGGSLAKCLSYSPVLIGLPHKVLFAPSWEERKAEIYLWYKLPSQVVSHVQIIRHEAPLPVRDTAGSHELVIDPFTPLTGHTVLLVDFGDSTIGAYNRRGGVPQRGVVARLADVGTVPLVQETLRQIEEARAVCGNKPKGQMAKRPTAN